MCWPNKCTITTKYIKIASHVQELEVIKLINITQDMTQYQDPIKEFAKELPSVVINVQEMVKLLINLLLE